MKTYLVAVTLWVFEGEEQAFRAFETKSLLVAASHGGRLVRAARLAENATGLTAPYEFHLLEFPNESSFFAFREDSASRALDGERKRVIVRAEIVAGEEISG